MNKLSFVASMLMMCLNPKVLAKLNEFQFRILLFLKTLDFEQMLDVKFQSKYFLQQHFSRNTVRL